MPDSEKIPVYFDGRKNEFKGMVLGNKYLLLRYFPDSLQIQGLSAGRIPANVKKIKGLDNYNRWVKEIPDDSKDSVVSAVKDWIEYEGPVTLLQDDIELSRVFNGGSEANPALAPKHEK
ncbi:MAG: hypothetical protein V3U72_04930 [Candidatus Aenigmarchaeota archaeon]